MGSGISATRRSATNVTDVTTVGQDSTLTALATDGNPQTEV